MTTHFSTLGRTHAQLQSIEESIQYMECIWKELQHVEAQVETKVSGLDASWRRSAINMLQYVELRKHDIRPLQNNLARLGLSSLGRAEAHVTASFKSVLSTLHHLADRPLATEIAACKTVDYSEGTELLDGHANSLLGQPQQERLVRIMVTMPSEAATDPQLVRDLLAAGMNCMRINCAHDDHAAWAAMIENLRNAELELDRHCHVLMDLAGPKLRTGAIVGHPVIKCRPQRDERGRVTAPSRIWLYPNGNPGKLPTADAHLPLDPKFLAALTPGDELEVVDTRGATRTIKIVEKSGQGGEGIWGEATHTIYFASGLALSLEKDANTTTSQICSLQSADGCVVLQIGDTLVLTASQLPGRDAVRDEQGKVVSPATVPCTLPAAFSFAKAGESIALDDGKFHGKITAVSAEQISVEITLVPPGGGKLRADKGINLPETQLDLPALTDEDLSHLQFVTEHADMVGMSFVERPADILQLQKRIRELSGKPLGIVLKIETRRAFQALPSLILAAMHYPCAGVMIARGDLAVECGFERMAEIQEEVLWLCEAAHMPVIWATQVLESMAKSGLPSRAEITDAAMGERAECVMLNKGPHILAAMRALNDILLRMEGHQHKKQALLRRLQSWEHATEICSSVEKAFK